MLVKRNVVRAFLSLSRSLCEIHTGSLTTSNLLFRYFHVLCFGISKSLFFLSRCLNRKNTRNNHCNTRFIQLIDENQAFFYFLLFNMLCIVFIWCIFLSFLSHFHALTATIFQVSHKLLVPWFIRFLLSPKEIISVAKLHNFLSLRLYGYFITINLSISIVSMIRSIHYGLV